jgi:hypothetical protein
MEVQEKPSHTMVLFMGVEAEVAEDKPLLHLMVELEVLAEVAEVLLDRPPLVQKLELQIVVEAVAEELKTLLVVKVVPE